MKFNIIILSVFAFLFCNTTYGQLLERENVERNIASGTRPVAGNMGYFIGPSMVELTEILDDELDIRGFPLMGVKYYFTDEIEFRLTAQIYGKSEKYNGTLTNSIDLEDNIEKESFYRFMPSVQYHFSNSNFLDTYAGLGIIFGSEKDEVQTTQKTNLSGDFYSETLSKSTFDYGFNLNFGLQAFVADLPIALAVETSIRGLKKANVEYEASSTSSVGGIVTEQSYYAISKESTSRFESLTYTKYEVGADLRFMITYFFRK